MSEPSVNSDLSVCRLCTSTKSGQMLIFGGDSENITLATKIKECLPIQVEEEDHLTKTICENCLVKVEDFHRFRQVCIFAQVSLEQQRLEREANAEGKSEAEEQEDALAKAKAKAKALASAEAEAIVERLQAGGDSSALSITPVKPHSNDSCKENDLSHIMTSSGALSITPVVHHQSESSADDDSQWGPSTHTPTAMPRLAEPVPEDYVLMREETFPFNQDQGDFASKMQNYGEQYEFREKGNSEERRKRKVSKDIDIMLCQKPRRFVLPPMWDVFEKHSNREVTHRRYVISKGSFPCSLCGSCVAFHQQQVAAQEKQIKEEKMAYTTKVEIKDEAAEDVDLEHPDDDEEMELEIRMEDQKRVHEEILQDLRVNQFPSQTEVLYCPQCGKVFPRRSSWRRHMRTHYEGRSFVCPLCGKGFNRKEHLSRHMMSHTGGRPFRCESCFKPFTRKEHLARHLACNRGCGGTASGSGSQGSPETDAGVPRPYTCDVCFQGFVRKEHMMRHRKRAHMLNYHALPPPPQEDDDLRLYSCNVCSKRFTRKEHLNRHLQIHERKGEREQSPSHSAHFLADSKEILDGPEQIEVEVNIGVLGEDSDVENDLSVNGAGGPKISDGTAASNAKAATSSTTSDNEDLELDDDDLIRMQINESMRQAREGASVPSQQTPRCQVCHNTFTRKSHLVRHLRRFHPQVELAYAAAYSLGGTSNPGDAPTQNLQGHEDDDDGDDENGNSVSRNGSSVIGPNRSKGGQHPCSLCGKIFGRRYHLVRHRRTQHGIENSKTGRVGRPPKKLPLILDERVPPAVSGYFKCSACSAQFTTHQDYQSHSCSNNNNNNNNNQGQSSSSSSTTDAPSDMQTTTHQDELLKGKDKTFDCNSCGETFDKQRELNKHVETHVQDLMKDMLWT